MKFAIPKIRSLSEFNQNPSNFKEETVQNATSLRFIQLFCFSQLLNKCCEKCFNMKFPWEMQYQALMLFMLSSQSIYGVINSAITRMLITY